MHCQFHIQNHIDIENYVLSNCFTIQTNLKQNVQLLTSHMTATRKWCEDDNYNGRLQIPYNTTDSNSIVSESQVNLQLS